MDTKNAMKQKNICKMKNIQAGVTLNDVKGEDLATEYTFWKDLREVRLKPEESAFNNSDELKSKLADLRNTCLMFLVVINTLWLIVVITIMGQQPLQIMGSSPLSLIFLALYTVVLLCQFVALILHRLGTLLHFIARAPFTPGRLKSNWSWYDEDLQTPPKPEELENVRRTIRRLVSTEHLKRKEPIAEPPICVNGVDNTGFTGETAM